MSAIYGLTQPETGLVRYVGKANEPRARLLSHIRDARRRKSPVCDWIRSLSATGRVPGMVILEADCKDWMEAERRIIAKYRMLGPLLNLADGGDQPGRNPEALQRGGRTAARTRDKRMWNLRRSMAQALRWLDQNGRKEKADAIRARHLVLGYTYG